MKPLRRVHSRTVVLPRDNVDTDQIIPARFLKMTDRQDLGRALFADWRYDRDGNPRPDFVLNRPESEGAHILVVGDNFGCGSSREHAAWALRDYGFRCLIGTRFADIFRNNALKNGLLPVEADRDTHRLLVNRPGTEVTVDLDSLTLTLPNGREAGFVVDGFARRCLLEGKDELDFLLDHEPEIAAFERRAKGH